MNTKIALTLLALFFITGCTPGSADSSGNDNESVHNALVEVVAVEVVKPVLQQQIPQLPFHAFFNFEKAAGVLQAKRRR